MLYSIKKWKNIWSEKGKCINFATAKEETGHAPGNFFVKFIEGIEEASVVQEKKRERSQFGQVTLRRYNKEKRKYNEEFDPGSG